MLLQLDPVRQALTRVNKENAMRVSQLVITLLSGLALAGVASEAKAQTNVATTACPAVDVQLASGLMERTFDAVKRNRICWTEAICSAISGFSQREYDQFLSLVREDSRQLSVDEIKRLQPKQGRQLYMHYTEQGAGSLKAYQCLEQKGENASPQAQMALYMVIETSPQRSPIRPYKWLKKAAEGGEPTAQYRLANEISNYYNHPEKAPPDYASELTIEKYREWLTKSAVQGLPQAQYRLALFYKGANTNFGNYPSDISAAIEWFKRAAAQTEDRFIRNVAFAGLGHLYFLGKQVPQDYQEAFRWYAQVDAEEIWQRCANPLVIVRSNLLRMYRDGLGVPKDPEKVKVLSKVGFGCV